MSGVARDLECATDRLEEEMTQMRERLEGLNEGFLQAIREEMEKREARDRKYQDEKFNSI